MRILHAVEFYQPSVGGAQEVVRQVSRRLAAAGHDVTVATTALARRTDTLIDGVRIASFHVSGNAVRGIRGDVAAYQRFVAEGDWDVIMVYAAQQWTCDALADVLPRLSAAKVLVPCGFSGLHAEAYRGYFAALPEMLRRYDRLLFHSATYQDHVFAASHGLGDRCVLVPNGCGADEFDHPASGFRERYGIPRDRPMLLTVGSHTGLKGHAETVRTLLSPAVPDATLAIIGNVLSLRGCQWRCRLEAAAARIRTGGRKSVRLLDPRRADVVAAYAAADLFLFLSNVECSPLVLYEAAAAGLPFVTADVGNAAEIAEWTGAGIVVPTRSLPNGRRQADVAAAARSVAELLESPARRETLGRLGRQRWAERFTWERIAGLYEAVYEDAIRRRAA
jgi:glycosyltransferase involved in cell wall biosynthesis